MSRPLPCSSSSPVSSRRLSPYRPLLSAASLPILHPPAPLLSSWVSSLIALASPLVYALPPCSDSSHRKHTSSCFLWTSSSRMERTPVRARKRRGLSLPPSSANSAYPMKPPDFDDVIRLISISYQRCGHIYSTPCDILTLLWDSYNKGPAVSCRALDKAFSGIKALDWRAVDDVPSSDYIDTVEVVRPSSSGYVLSFVKATELKIRYGITFWKAG